MEKKKYIADKNRLSSPLLKVLSTFLVLVLLLELVPLSLGRAQATDTLLNYNFLKLKEAGQYQISNITDYKYTTKGNAEEVNPDVASDPWYYVGFGNKTVPGTTNGARFTYEGTLVGANIWYGSDTTDYTGVYGAVMINVPSDGTYRAESVMGFASFCGICRVYLAPSNAANPRAAEYAIGTVDTYRAEEAWSQNVALGMVKLTSGNYILSYEIIGKNASASNAYLYIQQFHLNPMTATLSADTLSSISAGNSASTDLTATWSDSANYDISNETITVTSQNPDIATAELTSNTANGKKSVTVTGVSVGSTTVDVAVKRGGTDLMICSIPVTIIESVEPILLTYNFLKLKAAGILSDITDYKYTTKGNLNEINPDVASDPWYYVGFGNKTVPGTTNGARFTYEGELVGANIYYSGDTSDYTGIFGSVMINVPADATYRAESVMGFAPFCGICKVYLAPSNATNPRAAEYAIGTVDTYRAAEAWSQNVALGMVKLTSGDYVLSYEIIGKNANASNAYLYIQQFHLSPMTATLSADTLSSISAGNSASTDLTATWSDSTNYDISNETITVTSQNPNIATAELTSNTANGKMSVTVTGVSVGSTTLDVAVKRGGNDLIKCTIPVTIQKSVGPTLLTYNFLKLKAAGTHLLTDITDFKYTTAGNAAEINPDVASDPWYYIGFGNKTLPGYTGGARFSYEGDPVGASVYFSSDTTDYNGVYGSVMINVPSDGTYRAETAMGFAPYSGICKVYLAPSNAENPRAAEYAIGTVDTYRDQEAWNQNVALGMVKLTPGNYILSYEIIGKNASASNATLYIAQFRLNPMTAAISADTLDNIAAGDSASTDLNFTWRDGAAYDLSNETITVASQNPEIATAELTTNTTNGKKSVTVTGVSAGNTTVNVVVKRGSIELITCLLPVTIQQGATPVLQNYNFLKLKAAGSHLLSDITDFKFTTKGNIAEINSDVASDPWYYVGFGNKTVPGTTNGARFTYEGDVIGANIYYSSDTPDYTGIYGSLMIKVSAGGTYRAETVMGFAPFCGICKVYLAPSNATNPRAAEYAIGTVDTYRAEEAWNQNVALGMVKLTTGNYVLSYEIIGKNTNATFAYLYISAFNLKPVTATISADSLSGITEGDSASTDLTATWSDGAAFDLSNNTIIVTTQNPEIATAELSTNTTNGKKSVTVTGVSAGSTTVNVAVKRGSTLLLNCLIPVTILQGATPVLLNYNFLKLKAAGSHLLSDITDFKYTTAGNAEEINPDIASDPWYYVGFGNKTVPGVTGGARFTYEGDAGANVYYGGTLDYIGVYGSLMINVSTDGTYRAETVMGLAPFCGICRIYLAPSNATNPRAPEYAIKTVDTYRAIEAWKQNVVLGMVNLTSGNYILSYEIVGKNTNASNAYLYISSFNLKSATVRLSADSLGNITAGGSGSTDLTAVWNDKVACDLSNETITVTSQNPGIATAELTTNTSNGKKSVTVTGISVGSTAVNVVVKRGDLQIATCNIPVNITGNAEKLLHYNFWKLSLADANGGNYEQYGSQATDVKTITSFDMTTAGNANEIHSQSVAKTDPWHFIGIGGGTSPAIEFGYYFYGLILSKNQGTWAKFKVRVPTGGLYRASSINGYWTGGGIVRIYLAPDGAENPTATEYSLGAIDCYLATGEWAWAVEKTFGSRMLTAGDYTLTYQIVGKNPNNTGDASVTLGGFKLNPIDKAPTMDVSVNDQLVLKKDGSGEAVLSSAMSDGSLKDLYGATITATPRDSSIASVVVLNDPGKINQSIQVTGIKVGTTVIDISVAFKGQVIKNLTLPVTVEAGQLESLTLAVSDTSSSRIANKTSRSLILTMLDKDSSVIPSSAVTATYKVEPSSVAEVTADGVLHALSIGKATVTATVTKDDVTKNASVSIDVQESGDNLMANRNGDFESEITDSNWAWNCGYTAPANADSVFQWSEVATQPRDGNAANKALRIVNNPNVVPGNFIYLTLKSKEDGMVKLKPGKLYEFSFWMKTDQIVAPGSNMLNCYLDIYDNGAPNEWSAPFPASMYRSYNYRNESGYPDSYSGWKKITFPVSAPTDCKGDLWITPRIVFRTAVAETGFGGSFWLDDFQLSEVGFDHIEAKRVGTAAAIGEKSTIQLTPYSTTNNFISIIDSKIPETTTAVSSDTDIIKAYDAVAERYTGAVAQLTSMAHIPSIPITVEGKNGDATVTASITLGSETRRVDVPYSTSGLPNIIKTVSLTMGQSEIESGSSLATSLSAKRVDGTSAELDGATVYYQSSDVRIADVDQNGVIKAKQAGSADISVFVKVDGILRTDKKTIQVVDNTELKSVKLDPSDLNVNLLLKKHLTVEAIMGSGFNANLTNAEITYSILESQPEGTIEISETGDVTAKKLGEAKIKATVSLNGVTVESDIATVHVTTASSSDIVIDFAENPDGDPLKPTLESRGWQVDTENTSNTVLTTPTAFRYQAYGIQSSTSVPNTQRESDTVFDVLFQQAANYTFSFRGGNYSGGGIAAIYVDEKYMGKYDFYNGGSNIAIGKVEQMNSLYLNEGVHKVKIHTIDSNSNPKSYSQYIGMLEFTKIKDLPTASEVKFATDKNNLAVGESTNLEAEIMMSNGIPYRFGKLASEDADPNNYLRIDNKNTDVVSISDNGIITALKSGTAVIELNAAIDGTAFNKTITINVNSQKLTSINAKLDKSDIYSGDTAQINAAVQLGDGRILDNKDVSYSYESSNTDVITVENGKITAHAVGSANIKITALFGGETAIMNLSVSVLPEGFAKVLVTADEQVIKPDSKGVQLHVSCNTNLGNPVDIKNAQITYTSNDTGVATVDETGYVRPVAIGSSLITVQVNLNGITKSGELYISVTKGKTNSTYYTADKVAAARENIEKYSWAQQMKKDAVEKADIYVNNVDMLWDMVTTQELPRGIIVGYLNDPEGYTCRYCGADLMAAGGNYPWLANPLSDPWKIQCPKCMRRFPSNDFGSFYKLGIDEHGEFDYSLAKEKNAELVAKGEKGYLVNDLYPEKGEGWGVDDGYGYRTGKTYPNGVAEVHTYIAYYNHWGLWYPSQNNPGVLDAALTSLRDAYLYTGEAKYGRTGAILLDRIADLYPKFDLKPYENFYNSHGFIYTGKIIGCIWEALFVAQDLSYSYDAFYPMMDDPYVVNYLKEKSAKYKMENTKDTPMKIRQNSEDGILRSIHDGCLTAKINGNFGMHQSAMAAAAVVLDSMPETGEWIDWIFQSGGLQYSPEKSAFDKVTGGDVMRKLVTDIDRDGLGIEASPSYNNIWLDYTMKIADALGDYKGYDKANIYQIPKFRKMFTAMFPLTMMRRTTPQIGDSGVFAGCRMEMGISTAIKGFAHFKDVMLAQEIYFLNNNSSKDIHFDIFTKDPEKLTTEIQEIINKNGEYNFDKSTMQPGFGFAALRGGGLYKSAGVNATSDTQRSFSMYFGVGQGHGNPDALNLGVYAYGLDMAPDLGYPETADYQPNTVQWQDQTINHNTVVVNEHKQDVAINDVLIKNGTPMHFDDSGRVKVIDADAKKAYSETDIYRRTVVMVEASDDVSYGVDFFRILGGNDHMYSFHSQSDEISETSGFTPVLQPMGSYAGPTVEWGASDKYPNGYSWLKNVRKAIYPGTGEVSVDFKVKDFRKTLSKQMDLHLRMTMLNSFDLSEMTIAEGLPPRTVNNNMISKIEYVLARRKGKDLDSLFTTVYEPYNGKRYLKEMESVPVTCVSGSESNTDVVKAVKITHTNGRIDYIVYATNNNVQYRIDDVFNFRGFVGVYTAVDGKPVYSYVNDGDLIGDSSGGIAAVTGKVTDFTKDPQSENSITVTTKDTVDPKLLAGKFIYVANDGEENAAYEILSAKAGSIGTIILNIGDVTPIRSYKNEADINAGYIYNIAEGQNYRIPLSMKNDNSPVFDEIGKKTVDSRSQIQFIVSATSPIGKTLQYSATALPRGASFDEKTQVFKWIPDSGLIGENHVAITASDGTLSTTKHFIIKVLSATNGGGSNGGGSNGGGSNGGGSIGGGSNGGGSNGGGSNGGGSNGGGSNGGGSSNFIDMAGYDWAKDAVTALAEAGIIKGRGNTYAPGENITRADFTILLVRALKLTSESSENFIDVDANQYYAKELAIAKGCGIATGVGGNKYNPTAEISREDMMVIAVRAIEKAGYSLAETDEEVLSGFKDAAEISDYARTAVAKLITNGIITGADSKINPKGRATRAEIAVLIKRILDKQA